MARFVENRALRYDIGFHRHFREIASPTRLFVLFILMTPVFNILKIRAQYDLMFGKAKMGWSPYRHSQK
jgi:hypothetical protein